jgi:hypothetical protein
MEKQLYVPHDKDWNPKEKPLWKVDFDIVYVDEGKDSVWFSYQVSAVSTSQWDNYSVEYHLANKTLKGEGSRKRREFILDNVVYWYLKAKNEEEFGQLLF